MPGNLVCYQGKIISQGLDGVDAYFQLDAVAAEVQRRLAANPDDAEAISLRGEILLDAGKRSEAIASFRRPTSWPRPAEPRVAPRLALGRPAHRVRRLPSHRAEIERLLDAPAQRAAYLRLMAAGLRQAGEWAAAFECYQKLIDLEPDRRPLDQIGKSHLVRRDRWFQGQLAELRARSERRNGGEDRRVRGRSG